MQCSGVSPQISHIIFSCKPASLFYPLSSLSFLPRLMLSSLYPLLPSLNPTWWSSFLISPLDLRYPCSPLVVYPIYWFSRISHSVAGLCHFLSHHFHSILFSIRQSLCFLRFLRRFRNLSEAIYYLLTFLSLSSAMLAISITSSIYKLDL